MPKLLKAFNDKFQALTNCEDWRKREDLETQLSREDAATRSYKINCTGDVCRGDWILFPRAKWERQSINQYGKMANVIVGYDLIEGLVVSESYGKDKQQHTFTIQLPDKTKTFIKGRNLYAYGVWRKAWKDESERVLVLDEKHTRGQMARIERATRRENFNPF